MRRRGQWLEVDPSEDSFAQTELSIPDYKAANEKLRAQIGKVFDGYFAAMDKIEDEAKAGSAELTTLRDDYLSKLAALKEAQRQYPASKSTFEQTYALEKKRMQADLDEKYSDLIAKLQAEYKAEIKSMLTDSKALAMDKKEPTVLGDLAHNIVMAPADIIADAAVTAVSRSLWAPFIVPWVSPMAAMQGVWGDDNGTFDDADFYGPLRSLMPGLDDVRSHRARAADYDKLVNKMAAELFSNCTTSACVYALADDYKDYFEALLSVRGPVRVGDAKLKDGASIHLKRVLNVLNDAKEVAAKSKKDVAVFTPANSTK